MNKVEEEKKLFDFRKKIVELKHKYKMEELIYKRKSDAMFHENEMGRQRIKSAEIRKTQERREWVEHLKKQDHTYKG